MAHTFEVIVTEAAGLTGVGFDKVRVYRSTTGPGGAFSLLPLALDLNSATFIYSYTDPTGKPSYWYRLAYYNSTDQTEDSQGDRLLGGQLYYCRVSDLKANLNDGLTSGDDLLFIQKVQAATDMVRRWCGRDFSQVYETRYFSSPTARRREYESDFRRSGYGNDTGPQFGRAVSNQQLDLLKDDLISVESLRCDFSFGQGNTLEDWVEGRDYRVTWISGPGSVGLRPYNRLEVLSTLTPKSGYWPRGYRAIKITGVWGWPADKYTGLPVPAAVREATLEIAARLYKGKDNAYSRVVGNADLTGSAVVIDKLMNADALAQLQPYRRYLAIGSNSLEADYSSEVVAIP